jgi:Holliday junction resolvase-like predicted endonuclease
MPAEHGARGAAAERYAARALERDGYRILLRNHRTPAGEIDLVALRRGIVTFVEVKARRSERQAVEALTPAKLTRVARAAQRVMQDRGLATAPRAMMGAAVQLDAEGEPESVRFVPVEEAR